MTKLIYSVIASFLAAAASAGTASPYAGQETRDIKALSKQEIDDYLNGRGMGYAKAAELNRYPGPRHVLDLAKELGLTPEQTRRTQEIFDTMQTQARALGRQLVDREQELDRRFADNSMDAPSLETLLSQIAELQGRLRYVHLSAHLKQRSLLTDHQVRLYDRLRGYGAAHGAGHAHGH